MLRSRDASVSFPPEVVVVEGGGKSRCNTSAAGEGGLEDCGSVFDAHELSASMMVDKSADKGGPGEMLLSTGAGSWC